MRLIFILGLITLGMMLGAWIDSLLSPKKVTIKSTAGKNQNAVLSGRDVNRLPVTSAVYLICLKDQYEKPLYVGSTTNLKKRFSSHDTFKQICQDYGIGAIEVTWLGCDKDQLEAREQKLITRFKPPYNKAMIADR